MFNQKVKILNIKQETESVKTFFLQISRQDLDFKPGQYIMLTINSGTRSFSISSSPTVKNHIELSIKKYPDSKVAAEMHSLKVNDEVLVKGPFGRVIFKEENKNNIFLAAGNGITPLGSMINYIIDKKLDINMQLLYSNKAKNEIIFYNEFLNLAEKNKNFKPYFTLTQEDWNGLKGRIDKKMIQDNLNIKDATFYISGPNEFVEATVKIIKDLNIPQEKINREVFVRPTS